MSRTVTGLVGPVALRPGNSSAEVRRSRPGFGVAWAFACASIAGSLRAQFPYLVKDIAPSGTTSAVQNLQAFGGKVFFWAFTSATGLEPWISDGTDAGTFMLADIRPGSSWSHTAPSDGVEFNGFLYFVASDGVSGYELWRTDGTSSGTSQFFDFEPGAGSSGSSAVVVSNRLLIRATRTGLGGEFWVSDGTVAGTQLLLDIAPGSASGAQSSTAVFQNRLLFRGNDTVNGQEPWITDGTPAGTFMLADINPGAANSINSMLGASWSNLFFFAANDGVHGAELWATDGTPAGTKMVLDIEPGAGSSYQPPSAEYFDTTAEIASGLVFLVRTALHGEEPWITDGTAAGTHLLADLDGTSTSSNPIIVGIDAATALIRAQTPSLGYEPWVTDGTFAGMQLIDLWPGSSSGTFSGSQTSFGVAGRAYFPARQSGTGTELGTSDGTAAGTQLLKDLFPGGTTTIFYIRPVNDDFVLFASDAGIAYSNGLAATTQFVPNDPALPPLTQLGLVVRSGDRIFLTAHRADVETELFAIRVDEDGDGVIGYFDSLNVAVDCTCGPGLAPCSNDDASAGCANSTGLGARLDGTGSTVLTNDDLVLSVTQMPPFANGLVFVGSTATAPNTFFDGLRCVASPTSRYMLKNAGASGSFSYGPGLSALSASLPASLQFIAGRTLRFQAWYRDGSGPCGSGSNFSNSISATLTP